MNSALLSLLLFAAQELLGVPGAAHQVVIQLEDPAQADAVAASLKARLGDDSEVLTWGELVPVLAESFWIATLSVILGASFGALLSWQFSKTGFQLGTGGQSMQLEGATLSTLVKTRFNLTDVFRAAGFVYAMASVVGLYPASRAPPAACAASTAVRPSGPSCSSGCTCPEVAVRVIARE